MAAPSTTDDEVVDAELVVENMPAVREPSPSTALVARDEISIEELLKQSAIIEAAMHQAMKVDVHYGRIPGVNKPTLFKPGAEKLNVLFRLAPSYHSEKIWHDDGHLTVIARCVLTHIPTGLVVGEGEGLCTSKEAKYAYRNTERLCPECNEPQVRVGRPRDGRPGNWYCWKKQGGCGATWPLDSEQAKAFEAMETGRGDNPDLPDTYNTVLKMADKRALIAGVLNCTAASDVFTQDVEDMPRDGAQDAPAAREPVVDTDLLPTAIPLDKDYWANVQQAVAWLDGQVNWDAVFTQAAKGVWQVESWRELTGDDYQRFCRRLSNALAKVTELSQGADIVTDEALHGGFGFAFNGVKVDLVRGAVVAADSDIEFGKEEDATDADTAASPDS